MASNIIREIISIDDDSDEEMVARSTGTDTLSEISRFTGSRKRTPATLSDASTRPSKRPRLDSTEPGEGAQSSNGLAPVQRGPSFPFPPNSAELSEQSISQLLNDDSEELGHQNLNSTHLPLRMLNSFTFFTDDDSSPSRQVLGLEQLEQRKRVQIIGHGDVRSINADPDEEGAFDEDDENVDELSQQYRYFPCLLGPIIEWWAGDGVTNVDMYIRTESAWYLLEEPSALYRRTYAKFWRLHRISQLAVDYATKKPDGGLVAFKSALSAASDALQVIGRLLTDQDVDFAISTGSVKNDLNCLPSRLSSSIAGSRLVSDILDACRRRGIVDYIARSPAPPPGNTMSQERRTVVTPLVSHIAQRCFRHQLDVVGSFTPYIRQKPPPKERPQNRPDRPIERSIKRDESDMSSAKRTFYQVLSEQGGTSYEIDDCVAIKRGLFREQQAPDRSPSEDELVEESWFGVIRHLFTTSEDPNAPHQVIAWAHVQWFYHGSQTDIGELASSNELFLSYECDDIGLATIKRVVHVEYVGSTSKSIIPSDVGGDSMFFCRLRYDSTDGSFHDLSQPYPYHFSDIDFQENIQNHLGCHACVTRDYSEAEHGGHIFLTPKSAGQPEGFNYGNITYHQYDTILYVAPADERNLSGEGQQTERLQLQVGIIHKWEIEKSVARTCYVTVRRLEFVEGLCKQRADAIHLLPPMGGIPLDERQLYQTCDYVKIPIENIHRRCVVRCIPGWRPHTYPNSEPNEFFLTHDAGKTMKPTYADLRPIKPEDYRACSACIERLKTNYKYYRHFTSRGRSDAEGNPQPSPLDTMDLCCGAGGLSLGLDNTGVFEAKWAVDKDIQSGRTYRRNFPNAQVFIQDLNECVLNALKYGAERPEVASLDPEDNSSSHMPPPGQVKAIIAGPPWHVIELLQRLFGLTSAYYRPKFFLIENVPGMLGHRALNRDTGSVVQGAMVKIILRTVTALGYSVRWGLFNAANFGTPQQRTRIFFYGAKGGHRLPDVLVPTHITIKNSRTTYERPVGTQTRLTTNVAALPPVTLSSSIGDLPAFDW
ncbi:hypothetical protein FRC17_007395 [Serendipita sp. 399]|nr:hypothetical protein FRC17_007395 [Serendipita sp. 399]